MKIVQINTTYGDADSTGRNTKDIHEWLLERGEDSKVFCVRFNDVSCEADSVELFSSTPDQKIHGLLSRLTGLQGYFSPHATRKLLRRLEEEKPDVVLLGVLHSNCIHFPLLFKYFREKQIPVIIVLHDCWFFTGHCTHFVKYHCEKWKTGCAHCPGMREDNVSWFFDTSRKCYRNKQRWYQGLKYGIVGVSDWITGISRQSVLGSTKYVRRIYNWIDQTVFCPKDKRILRANYRFSETDKIIIAVASVWSEIKGLSTIAYLAKKIPDSKVLLVGRYRELGVRLASNIYFIGHINQPKRLAEYYALSDVFVNPSEQETFGKTTAEAICCGLPVVAYRNTGTTEIVEGAGGILVESGDREGFSEAVQRLFRSENSIEAVKTGHLFALNAFDKEENIRKYHDFMKEMISA